MKHKLGDKFRNKYDDTLYEVVGFQGDEYLIAKVGDGYPSPLNDNDLSEDYVKI